MNVNLHIERLVLEGAALTPEDLRAIQLGLEVELTSMLAERSLRQSSSAAMPERTEFASHQKHSVTRGSSSLVQQIARTIHQRLPS